MWQLLVKLGWRVCVCVCVWNWALCVRGYERGGALFGWESQLALHASSRSTSGLTEHIANCAYRHGYHAGARFRALRDSTSIWRWVLVLSPATCYDLLPSHCVENEAFPLHILSLKILLRHVPSVGALFMGRIWTRVPPEVVRGRGGRCAGADARTRGERIPCQTRAENRLRLGGTRGNEGVLLPFQTWTLGVQIRDTVVRVKISWWMAMKM